MKQLILFVCFTVLINGTLFAQKDTVEVMGVYNGGAQGSLNDAIDLAVGNATINNTVFKLMPYDVYVLTKAIFMGLDQNLEIVAPKPGLTQESAPPQIVWTSESIDRDYIIQTYGNVTLKNIWIRYATLAGDQVSSSITFEDSSAQGDDQEFGTFEGVIFDYCPIGSEAGGAITVKANHFIGKFTDCYFRNLSDNHFQYYGRAVSYPYQSVHFHCDTLLFENTTFSNLSRIVMQEGNEFADNVNINHCTLINSVEWVFQSAGWVRNCSITNSIFINPYMMGYTPNSVCVDSTVEGKLWVNGQILSDSDVMDRFNAGLCDEPGGGLMSGIAEVDSFGFTEFVDFTDYDRGLYIAHNVYMTQDWLAAWQSENESAKALIKDRHNIEIRQVSPMLSKGEWAFIDSTDNDDAKVFVRMNVDTLSIYSDDPGFIVEPTDKDTLKIFMEGKWYAGYDANWAYNKSSGFLQEWPLPEDLAYTNTAYQTAAMGGFPLGDLNWYSNQKTSWQAQRDAEWTTIKNWLDFGGVTSIREISGATPKDYVLKQNYPNPFNPTTNIEYSIPVSGKVSLTVFNSLGQNVVTLYNDFQKAGSYSAKFNGRNLSSGVYFYQLQAKNVTLTKKFILIK